MTSPEQPDFGIMLALAYQQFVRELHAHLATQGFDDLGNSDGFVFRALGVRPRTISALATHLDISKQGAAQIVDDMERRGYVIRRPDPDDARARLIELSVRGNAALSAARGFHHGYQQRLVARHGEATVTGAREILAGMVEAAEADGLDPRLRALYI